MTLLSWLHVIALVGALVVFALHAGGVQPTVRPQLLGLGLALLTAALIFASAGVPVPALRP